MNSNKSLLTIIVLSGAFLIMTGPANNNSFAQTNQSSNNQSIDNKSSSSLSNNTLAKTSRVNGLSIATSNEHATFIKKPVLLNQTTTTTSEKAKSDNFLNKIEQGIKNVFGGSKK